MGIREATSSSHCLPLFQIDALLEFEPSLVVKSPTDERGLESIGMLGTRWYSVLLALI
jgi:hypothetical protein